MGLTGSYWDLLAYKPRPSAQVTRGRVSSMMVVGELA